MVWYCAKCTDGVCGWFLLESAKHMFLVVDT
jgi:hypothetical protein